MRAGSASPSTRSSALDGVDLDLSVGQVHGLVGPNGAGKTTLLGLLLGRRRSRPTLLCAALGLQAIGIALPALAGGPVTAVTAAVLFRATFLGVGSLSLALGAHLQVPRARSRCSLSATASARSSAR